MAENRKVLSEDMSEVARESISSILKFLKHPSPGKMDLAKAKVAGGTLASYTRAQQTESALKATEFMIARDIAKDRDELRRYIKLTAPAHPMLKA